MKMLSFLPLYAFDFFRWEGEEEEESGTGSGLEQTGGRLREPGK